MFEMYFKYDTKIQTKPIETTVRNFCQIIPKSKNKILNVSELTISIFQDRKHRATLNIIVSRSSHENCITYHTFPPNHLTTPPINLQIVIIKR